MEVCVKHEVPIIITSLQAPQEIFDAVKSYGGIVLHDVINIRHTKKALSQGATGIVAVCAGAVYRNAVHCIQRSQCRAGL